MSNIITTQIVKIGNSQGVRIPKPLLEQVGLNGAVQLEVEADHLILSRARAGKNSISVWLRMSMTRF